jgi:hypothetical protein
MGCKKERLLKKNQNQNQMNFNKTITKKILSCSKNLK